MRFISRLAVLLLAGCATTDAGPQLRPAYLSELELAAPPQAVVAGGTIPLTLTNRSGQAVGVDLCRGALERRVAGIWVPALTAYHPCPEGLAPLAPGAQTSGVAAVPSELESDEYRYVTEVSDLIGTPVPQPVRSNPFHVLAVSAQD